MVIITSPLPVLFSSQTVPPFNPAHTHAHSAGFHCLLSAIHMHFPTRFRLYFTTVFSIFIKTYNFPGQHSAQRKHLKYTHIHFAIEA